MEFAAKVLANRFDLSVDEVSEAPDGQLIGGKLESLKLEQIAFERDQNARLPEGHASSLEEILSTCSALAASITDLQEFRAVR